MSLQSRARRRSSLVIAVALLVGIAVPAFAASSTDVQANAPQVAGDPTSNTTAVFPTNKQNEPTIAVNPRDARFLIAGSNDEQEQPPCGPGPVRGPDAPANDCSFFLDVGTSGVYTSNDGGRSWTNRGLLDDQPGWRASAFVSDGDPVITYGPRPDANGVFSWANGVRAYFASLASYKSGRSPFPPKKAPEYIAVSWSDDNGRTWSGPSIATTKDNPVDFNDKEWVAVDSSSSSPFFGRVYVSWTSFRQSTSEPVEVSYSTDGGVSFGPPNQVSPAANTLKKGRQGSQPVVGRDGSVYVTFEQGPAHVVVTSRDGGVKWTRPAVVASVADLDDPIPGANFRTNSFSSFAADPGDAGRLVLAWSQNVPGQGGRIFVVRSNDKGRTWSAPVQVSTAAQGYAFYQGLSIAPNGRVDVGYQALRTNDPSSFGTGNAWIDSYYAMSTDRGATFSRPARISAASSDPAASAQNNLQRQFYGDYNQMVSAVDRAWFIYTDTRNGLGCPAVDEYQQFLIDNGLIIRGDMVDRIATRTGATPALEPGEKPAPPVDCPVGFGNSDAFVSVITP
jgi:hypothetical protein